MQLRADSKHAAKLCRAMAIQHEQQQLSWMPQMESRPLRPTMSNLLVLVTCTVPLLPGSVWG